MATSGVLGRHVGVTKKMYEGSMGSKGIIGRGQVVEGLYKVEAPRMCVVKNWGSLSGACFHQGVTHTTHKPLTRSLPKIPHLYRPGESTLGENPWIFSQTTLGLDPAA